MEDKSLIFWILKQFRYMGASYWQLAKEGVGMVFSEKKLLHNMWLFDIKPKTKVFKETTDKSNINKEVVRWER